MSECGDQGVKADLRSAAAKDQAADWLWRRQAAEWSNKDQIELDAWLAESHYNLVAYWRLKAAWDRTERLAALRPGRMQSARASSVDRPWLKLHLIAATFAVAAVLIAATYRWATHEDLYATAVGQRSTVNLADGSQIVLNTNSAISVTAGMWERRVVMSKGEAFFRVRHDAARPFVVLAAGHRITDLGTTFSVRTSGDRLEVTLVEGRARLETASAGIQHHATDLTPGEVAVATADLISVSKLTARSMETALAWRQGKLIFNHVTMAEAAVEFNRYNRTKLLIQPNAADLKISGTFEAGSIGPFVTVAKLAFGLQTEDRGQDILVLRKMPRPLGRGE